MEAEETTWELRESWDKALEQRWKNANIILQGTKGLFSAWFSHTGGFYDGEENSTVAENDHDLLNEPDLY